MVLAALQINQAHGLLEMHFGIFALLAFTVYYRDWLPIVVAAATIAVHHLSFFALQQQGAGVYLVPEGTGGVVFLHAFYVVLESAILIYRRSAPMPKPAKAKPCSAPLPPSPRIPSAST